MPWIRLPWAIPQWIVFGIIKLVLKYPIGWPAVLFSVAGDGAKRTPKMWRFFADAEGTPWQKDAYYPRWMPLWRWLRVFWWNAERNPVPGMAGWFDLEGPFKQWGYADDMEQAPGFAWRWRSQGWKDGLRIVWGPPRDKGKHEFWVGFQMGSVDPGFTFQFR